VDDARLVGGVEPGRELVEDLQGLAQGQAALLVHVGAQVAALEELHDQVQPPVGERAEVEDLHDVGVVYAVDRPGLGEEPGGHVRVRRELVVEDLDRDLAADLRVLAEEDLAHGPGPHHVTDVVVPDRLADERVLVIHEAVFQAALLRGARTLKKVRDWRREIKLTCDGQVRGRLDFQRGPEPAHAPASRFNPQSTLRRVHGDGDGPQ